MSIVTFWNGTDEQCGTTSSSLAFATQTAIEHNMKVLLISTSLNDSLIRDSFWKPVRNKGLGLFSSTKQSAFDTNGVEGLDRVIRSNKISPDIITDYTKIVLTDRLEILLGIEGTQGQFDLIKDRYSQIVSLAGKYYDMVIVDLDRKVGQQAELDILNASDIVVAMIPQRAKQIEKIKDLISKNKLLKAKNTIIAIGKYFNNTKYNAKNISRNLLKQKDIINVIPYNNLFFEASQEGKVIDLFLSFMRIREKDENYNFIQELKRLYEMIDIKLKMLRIN